MPDDVEFDEEYEDQEPNVVRTLRKQAEEARKEAKAAQAELASLQRETAFRRAGIDPDDAKLRYFVKGYDGETEAEAIRTAAIEAGFLQPPTGASADELAAHERFAQAAGGAAPPLGAGDWQTDYLREIEESDGTVDQVMAIAKKYNRPTSYDTQ